MLSKRPNHLLVKQSPNLEYVFLVDTILNGSLMFAIPHKDLKYTIEELLFIYLSKASKETRRELAKSVQDIFLVDK